MNKLQDLLRLNKDIKIKSEERFLQIIYKGNIIKSIELLNDLKIENNEDLIYESIISIENINLYIPKIYTRES